MNFSLNDKYISVAYHYVEDPSKERSGIHPCSIKEFEREVKFLSENFHIVSLKDLYDGVKNKSNEKLCSLTFDDGLKGQYQNAVPILKKYNATGEFFIITNTFYGHVPLAHKIHFILSYVKPKDLVDGFHNFLDTHFPIYVTKYHIPLNKHMNEIRQQRNENVIIANFKEILIIAPDDIKNKFLNWIFKKYKFNEKEINNELFMSKEEVSALDKKEFIVGCHTHEHRAFNTYSLENIRNDIHKSKKHLGAIVNTPITSFCYPNGRLSKNLDEMLSVLRGEGLSHAVTEEKKSFKIFR